MDGGDDDDDGDGGGDDRHNDNNDNARRRLPPQHVTADQTDESRALATPADAYEKSSGSMACSSTIAHIPAACNNDHDGGGGGAGLFVCGARRGVIA